MEGKEPPNLDGNTRYRKFGLPNWMMNNIERLNFATDFEQYACSPPENESFLTENIDNCDLRDSPLPVTVNELPEDDKPKIVQDVISISESKSTPNLLAKATEQIASLSIIENMKQEELYSSPDTTPCATPCATPEPSPLIRRRLSGQMQPDSVQTNPGRWFYLGNFKKPDPNPKGQNLNAVNKKVNKIKQIDKTSDSPNKIKSPIKQKKEGMKLMISNFDINAISPSSW